MGFRGTNCLPSSRERPQAVERSGMNTESLMKRENSEFLSPERSIVFNATRSEIYSLLRYFWRQKYKEAARNRWGELSYFTHESCVLEYSLSLCTMIYISGIVSGLSGSNVSKVLTVNQSLCAVLMTSFCQFVLVVTGWTQILFIMIT